MIVYHADVALARAETMTFRMKGTFSDSYRNHNWCLMSIHTDMNSTRVHLQANQDSCFRTRVHLSGGRMGGVFCPSCLWHLPLVSGQQSSPALVSVDSETLPNNLICCFLFSSNSQHKWVDIKTTTVKEQHVHGHVLIFQLGYKMVLSWYDNSFQI